MVGLFYGIDRHSQRPDQQQNNEGDDIPFAPLPGSSMGSVRVLAKYCPVSSSFTSSHACNHFALATFLFLTLRITSRWWSLVFVWAFLIAYAQVYVGVHYPVDVLCGGLLGCGIDDFTGRLFLKLIGSFPLPTYKHGNA